MNVKEEMDKFEKELKERATEEEWKDYLIGQIIDLIERQSR